MANKMKKSKTTYNKENVPNTTMELGLEFSGGTQQRDDQIEEVRKQNKGEK